jgi:hypothetical protein
MVGVSVDATVPVGVGLAVGVKVGVGGMAVLVGRKTTALLKGWRMI